MGPRLLCFAAGAAKAAFFVHLGLLATPFFGSGSFLWASVLGCFLLAVALGYGLGDAMAALAGRVHLDRAAPRLAAAGAVSAWLAAYFLPDVCRMVLERDATWMLAPAVSIAIASLVPGSLMSAVVPSQVRACVGEGQDAQQVARSSHRLLGLLTLGGAVGILASGRAVLRADEVDVWLRTYALAALLGLVALIYLRPVGRVVSGVALLGCLVLSIAAPSEIQTQQFAVALETSWKRGQGAGIYFFRTTHEDLLSDEELRIYTEQVRVEEDKHGKPGAILTCELLEQLGAVSVTGRGLTGSLELLLPADAKQYLLPIFEQFESVRSDGQGLLSVTIKRTRGQEGTRCRIPGAAPGEYVEFWFRDDFTVHMVHEKNVWRLEFGPLTIEKAGIFELNDTHSTPVRLPNVKLWVDASLLGIVLEDHPDQVVVKAIAQGEIGDVTEVEVQVLAKGG
jgi:hypothetical protein